MITAGDLDALAAAAESGEDTVSETLVAVLRLALRAGDGADAERAELAAAIAEGDHPDIHLALEAAVAAAPSEDPARRALRRQIQGLEHLAGHLARLARRVDAAADVVVEVAAGVRALPALAVEVEDGAA